jgi:hypothetical protein
MLLSLLGFFIFLIWNPAIHSKLIQVKLKNLLALNNLVFCNKDYFLFLNITCFLFKLSINFKKEFIQKFNFLKSKI